MAAGKQILVIEDERPIREMIAFGLRRAGFEVREAEDCRSARVELADRRPDLLLVDWMLPDMSGLELTRQLKRERETRELPIILLTARAEEPDKISGLDGGADDYVAKPFSQSELRARARAALRLSEAQASLASTADELRIALDSLRSTTRWVEAAVNSPTPPAATDDTLRGIVDHLERLRSRQQKP